MNRRQHKRRLYRQRQAAQRRLLPSVTWTFSEVQPLPLTCNPEQLRALHRMLDQMQAQAQSLTGLPAFFPLTVIQPPHLR